MSLLRLSARPGLSTHIRKGTAYTMPRALTYPRRSRRRGSRKVLISMMAVRIKARKANCPTTMMGMA